MANTASVVFHFVLVHGVCHGAWSWYKVKPQLEAAGHRVTAFDLAASGINNQSIEDVGSFHEYSKPLLEILASIPSDEKVILVGHSLGGLNVALGMDYFPHKISVAVFVSAFMPDTTHQSSYVLDKLAETAPADPADFWQDTQFVNYSNSDPPLMSLLFGPKFLASNLYQLSPVEDLELAKVLVRPGPSFQTGFAKGDKYSNEGYGAVTRVYVVCDEDKVIPVDFQRWMIQNYPVREVREINGADHMAMNSKPKQLSRHLLEIAHKCS
ncbi:salicylic acid-binding protein 2-like [Tripterygium wilfordii]|uniref:salicylic acid-binding protein 2-like n=1 Tax=Tripterygium wilfordii TaxID=458696 RepID=UPI0018F83C0E|nr:salicylic acid-binding protein 2-like [Tripterygium wilfordii]